MKKFVFDVYGGITAKKGRYIIEANDEKEAWKKLNDKVDVATSRITLYTVLG